MWRKGPGKETGKQGVRKYRKEKTEWNDRDATAVGLWPANNVLIAFPKKKSGCTQCAREAYHMQWQLSGMIALGEWLKMREMVEHRIVLK